MGLLANGYYLHKQRQISQISRRATSLQQLQKECKKRGINMQFREGRNKFISFSTSRNFKIHSKKGADRVYTNIVENRIKDNAEHWKDKQIQDLKAQVSNQYERFENCRNNREERTQLERQEMFSNRGLER